MSECAKEAFTTFFEPLKLVILVINKSVAMLEFKRKGEEEVNKSRATQEIKRIYAIPGTKRIYYTVPGSKKICIISGTKGTDSEDVRAFLGGGVDFTGKMIFHGAVRIDSHFKGDIIGGGLLVIGEGAVVEANIHVDNVVICGEARGRIYAKEIMIYQYGRLNGDVYAPVFSLEKGAYFEGTCHMTGSESEVHPLPPEQVSAKDTA